MISDEMKKIISFDNMITSHRKIKELLPQIEAQEQLIKELLKIVVSKRKEYISCALCIRMGYNEGHGGCKMCKVKRLEDAIQKAREILNVK